MKTWKKLNKNITVGTMVKIEDMSSGLHKVAEISNERRDFKIENCGMTMHAHHIERYTNK